MRFFIILFFLLLSYSLWSQSKIRLHKQDKVILNLPHAVQETSSLFFSNGILWTHNDDNDNKLYGFQLPVTDNFTTITFSKLNVTDWEETKEDANYFYIGDFGNNAHGNRKNLHVLRIHKETNETDTIGFYYPEQTNFSKTKNNKTNFDCEAFLVDNDYIHLFTKEWKSKRSTLYHIPNKAGWHAAERVSQLKAKGLITGATVHPSNKIVVLTAYSKLLQPYLVVLYDFNGNDYFSGKHLFINIKQPFSQIEGVAFLNAMQLVVSRERFYFSFIKRKETLFLMDLKNTFIKHQIFQ
jgi:hypothetical protein